jgi:hypothetical protein
MMKDFLKNADPDSDASSVRLKEFLTIYKKFFKHTSTGEGDTQEIIALEEFLTLMKNYVRHTPSGEGDTKTTVGLDDLITAIKGINSGGGSGGGGSSITLKSEALEVYRNKAEAESDGWSYSDGIWHKEGYDDVTGEETDEVAQGLPTYKYVQKLSIVEMGSLTDSIDRLTEQVKRIADSMTNSNS